MAVNLVSIASNDQITSVSDGGTTTDLLFTASGGATQINAITVSNSSSAVVWMSFWILAPGAVATSSPATWTQAVAAGAGGTLDATTIIHGLIGQSIPLGGTLRCDAGTTNVCYVTASGVNQG